MANKKLPVIAAIPNYNMAEGLKRLLPQVIAQGYDHIYVLDDASTDNSKTLVQSFGSKVTFIEGKLNQGAGGARNMLIPYLKQVSLIHFMDADISLVSQNNPLLIRELGIDVTTAFVGGLVFEDNGKQSLWNYGPILSIAASTTGAAMNLFPSSARHLKSRPHPAKPVERRQTFWVLERSFIIRSDTLRKLGGFDAAIREHDIQPLAFKARKAGLVAWFDPRIIVKSHQDINVRHYNRLKELFRAEFYLVHKYDNLLRWLFPFTNRP